MKNCFSLAVLAALLSFQVQNVRGVCPCSQHADGTTTDDTNTAAADQSPPPPFNYQNDLTGDWFGLRNTLLNDGIDITASYTAEPEGNPVGGERNGFTYLHNIGVGVTFDLEKIARIPNTTFLVTISQRSGNSLTNEAVGNAISVQQIFGGGQTLRLVQMRFDTTMFDGRFALSYGRLTTTSDFLNSQYYCQFVNNGICGQPVSPFFNIPNGLTAYPAGYWAALGRVQVTKNTYFKLGVYDGDPNSGYSLHGTNFGFGDNGVLLMAEAGYTSDSALFCMPGRYSIGGFYHSGHFPDVAEDASMNNLFVTGLPGREHWGQEGGYLIFEQMLHRNFSRPDTGLESFVTFVASPNEDESAMPYYLDGGLVYEGLIPDRPNDKTALGFYSAWFSSSMLAAERAAGLSSQTCETLIELNHQIQFTPWFYLRPDLQYVIKPNGVENVRDALVLGVEVGVVF